MQLVTSGLRHTLSTVMVFQSDEYGLFKMITGNRQLNERKIKRIIGDINNGIDVLRYYPIQVVEKNKRLEILDGQHRFFIAKKLKRPVHYIVMKEERKLVDVAKINSNVEKWKPIDFINCYIQQGNADYKSLQEFIDNYHFSISTSMKLLCNGNPGTEGVDGKTTEKFQRGEFKARYIKEAISIADNVKLFSGFEFHRERGFVIAIYRIVKADKIKIQELQESFKKNPTALTRHANFKDYIYNLEQMFNLNKQKRRVIY